jgi:hypothetical protein
MAIRRKRRVTKLQKWRRVIKSLGAKPNLESAKVQAKLDAEYRKIFG